MKRATTNGKGFDGRIVDIVADAESLGVSRVHLWLVLTGRRPSKSLTQRYHALRISKARKVIEESGRAHVSHLKSDESRQRAA